jgi:hypothetical protein
MLNVYLTLQWLFGRLHPRSVDVQVQDAWEDVSTLGRLEAYSSFPCFCHGVLVVVLWLGCLGVYLYLHLDCYVLRNHRVNLYWCIMRIMSYDFRRLYDVFLLRLFYDYNDLWLFWINDEVTFWIFVIICWFYY